MNRNALVTLAIGQSYAERFEHSCRRNWTFYAERHGFDVIVIKDPLDESARARARSPAWQKCLVLGTPEAAQYERIAWVDSDICLNPEAPSILDGVPPDAIGATDEHAYPSPAARRSILETIIACSPERAELGAEYWLGWRDPGLWHERAGLPPGQAHIVQTGVLVMSPAHHRELLEHVYYSYEECGLNYEMRPLSHEIQTRKLQHWIDPRFNALVWWLYLQSNMGGAAIASEAELAAFVLECYRRNYFLHFAGAGHLMASLNV